MSTQRKQHGFAHAAPATSALRLLMLAAAMVLLFSGAHTAPARAQDQAANGKIYVVTHVDIIPTQKAAGTKLVEQYVADTRKDPGIVRIEASAEIARDNHISVVEVWENKKAFDDHIAAPHTRQFRQQLDPMLGSPYDERLHRNLE